MTKHTVKQVKRIKRQHLVHLTLKNFNGAGKGLI